MATPQNLFHWTHKDNVESITANGLDPEYATGAEEKVWCCDTMRIGWALSHVAARHGWNVSDMVLLYVETLDNDFQRSQVRGAYTCRHPVHNVEAVSVSLTADQTVRILSGPVKGTEQSYPSNPDTVE